MKYAGEIATCCGGIPTENETAQAECTKRSAITYLEGAAGVPLDINAGIHDGHGDNSVPVSQSLRAFNVLAAPEDRLTEEEIAHFTEREEVPPHLAGKVDAPDYGDRLALFRRSSRNVRITIFEGGHDIIHGPALTWLSAQVKSD